ncbi:hypothetical protein OS914_11550 [Arthrobacter sp. H14-L1]|nr:hypothetical protein [Arthrobacter sp. H14-L1]
MSSKARTLYLDNAADFKSEALSRGCEQHGITLNYRPVRRPHYGGTVEPVNSTVMAQVHELSGTTFSNPVEGRTYDSDTTAALTLRELKRWLALTVGASANGAPARSAAAGLNNAREPCC